MSPRTTTVLALIGVLLAGIPLPELTAARRPAAEVAAVTPTSMRQTYATLQCSGSPAEMILLHEGRELARVTPSEAAEGIPVELELLLPPADTLELELQARWPQGGSPRAITLTLEPDGLPQRQSTLWTEPGSASLHSLFSFSW